MRSILRHFSIRVLAVLTLTGVGSAALPAAEPEAPDDSFAEVKIVLQISDFEPRKQTLVLNVANNLIKHYGPDLVAIEIVAFGPGLRLLLAENSNRDRIAGLAGQGVRFAACDNTMRKFTKDLGEEPPLNPHAVRVSAGVVRIVDLVGQGYLLIKP